MKPRDQAILGALVALLVLIAASIGLPALAPAVLAPASPTPSAVAATAYVEGVIGTASEISPLAMRSRPDRDIVALVFSGLVRLGPGQSLLPDLADHWHVDSKGVIWTFHLRPGTVWQDGVPLTADDVVFTIRTLQDPAYTGPGSSSWSEVTATALDDRTVQLRLETPLGGFLQAATQPIVPAHLLRGVAAGALSDDAFNRSPIGSGPYRLASLDEHGAVLLPASAPGAAQAPTLESAPPPPTDALATPGPSSIGGASRPYIPRIEFRFFADAPALAAAYRSGALDAASGLPPASAIALGQLKGSRLLHYPGTTLLAVVFDLRPTHPEFRDVRARRGLLEALDRDVIVANDLGGLGVRADSLIPPSSWAFDPTVSKPVAFDPAAAEKSLLAAGWKQLGGSWGLPGAKAPATLELLSADQDTSPVAFSVAESVAHDWRQIGLVVDHVGLAPTDLAATHLRTGNFAAAVIPINIGLDPDLYPYLASTQTLRGGSNVSGLQDAGLDDLLETARQPGSVAARTAAYTRVQAKLAAGVYMLPIAFRDDVVVVRDTVTDAVARPLGDVSERFWDVLTWRLASDR